MAAGCASSSLEALSSFSKGGKEVSRSAQSTQLNLNAHGEDLPASFASSLASSSYTQSKGFLLSSFEPRLTNLCASSVSACAASASTACDKLQKF